MGKSRILGGQAGKCLKNLVIFFFFLFREFSFCSFSFFIFIFGCAGSSLLYGLVCSWGKRGLLSTCSARASRCGGFSCCRAWALGTQDSVAAAGGLGSCSSQALEPHTQWLWHTGLVTLRHMEFSWTRDQTCVSCVGRQILYH